MKKIPVKDPLVFNSECVDGNTLIGTYNEDYKSQPSSPNTIVHKSSEDLQAELFNTMKFLKDAQTESKSLKEYQKLEVRKSLLKIINKEQGSNKLILKQVIRTFLPGGKNEQFRKVLLKALENSDSTQFFLVFNELGKNNPPIGLYKLNANVALKLAGSELLPENLTDASIRFSLKFDPVFSKFKVIKSKSFSDDFDAIILR